VDPSFRRCGGNPGNPRPAHPPPDRLWHLGNYWTLTIGDEIEQAGKTARYIAHAEHIWALPADRQPVIALAPNERLATGWADDTCVDTSRQVHFAGPSYISYTAQAVYSCGVHPDGEIELRVVPLDQLQGERVPVSKLLGPAAPGAIREGIHHAEKGDCFEEPQVDERSWQIVRRQGHWAAEGCAETHRTCGYGVDFDIDLPLPGSVAGYDRLPSGWNALATGIPGLFDAFSSPTQDLLIVTTKMELRVYRLDHGRLGRMILRRTWTQLHLDSRNSRQALPVVMAQWATGRDVARWSRELRKIAALTADKISARPARMAAT